MALADLIGLKIYERSVVHRGGATYALARIEANHERCLVVLGDTTGFQGIPSDEALLCPLTSANAALLRSRLPWLHPSPLGRQAAAGMGDRLGLATPGHIQAVRGTGLAPVLAQQSVRENTRTGRSPQQVLDDAMWGAFQEGWTAPWGADADHLKTPADASAFASAGYTFFTIDPGDHVDNAAQTDDPATLARKVTTLPWEEMMSSPLDMERRYLTQFLRFGWFSLGFDPIVLQRAAAKYGRAIAHTASMYRHICSAMGARPFDLEVSIDETATPTSVHEHFIIASELQRLGVYWVSMAPRFVGRFEKGVDYQGSLFEFEAEFAKHAAVMRYFGGYKLSLHSGSDKFSVYAIANRLSHGLIHLKTAGTSYLEALRVLAANEPQFFREILTLARGRYDTDRATYHVSAEVARVADPATLSDADLPRLLDQFDARQVLHVTFGSVLDAFGPQIKSALAVHEDAYQVTLRRHFKRHVEPLSQRGERHPTPPMSC